MPRHSTPSVEEYIIAFSYIRFSHPDQAKGDSLRRQIQAAAEWCEHNKAHLDSSLTLHDLGKSAFTGEHRKNPDRHALAAFLRLIEQGRVPRGSYLIIENLDRLSREEEVPACHLLTSILMAGVRVVQLKPEQLVLTEKSPGWDIMRAVMELSRGHGESARKSQLVGDAWQEKKNRARKGETQKATNRMGEGCHFMTRRIPRWLEVRDGKLHLIPERAAAIKRIFELAIGGYGQLLIIKKLNEEGIKPFGSAPWSRAYVDRILNDRRVLGEHQPRKRNGEVDGEPIKNYYPAIIKTEAEWLAARSGQEQRFKHRGRSGHYVNAFAGLLFNARAGDAYYCRTAPTGGNRSARRLQRVLVNYDHIEGRAPMVSFPFPTFEKAILSRLREIKPKEILDGTNGHNDVMTLEGEKGQLEKDIAILDSDLDSEGESPTLYARLRRKETRLGEVNKLLLEAQKRAANPLSTAWGEAQSLIDVLESAPDKEDCRLRIRTALRRIVDSIWLLVVPRGIERLAAVQIWFAGGEHHRDYLILHRPPRANARARTEGGAWCCSLADAAKLGPTDLRNPKKALGVAEELAEMDLSRLTTDKYRLGLKNVNEQG